MQIGKDAKNGLKASTSSSQATLFSLGILSPLEEKDSKKLENNCDF